MNVVVPDGHIMAAFTKIVDPLLARAEQVIEESATLAALCDTLLPKLISGELRVRRAERLIGATL